MEFGQGLDEGLAGPCAARLIEQVGRPFVSHDVAVDEGHDVERRAVDRLVGAQAQGARHRDTGRPQGADHRVFALHVVGGGKDVAHRRPSQGEGASRSRSVTRKVRLERPPAISSNRKGGSDSGMAAAIQAVTPSWSIPSVTDPRGGLPCFHAYDATRARYPAPGQTGGGQPRGPSSSRLRRGRQDRPGIVVGWSTSPMPRSKRRSSDGRRRSRLSWTCGRPGVARARRSGRSSSRWWMPPKGRWSWPRSTSTRTRPSREAFRCSRFPRCSPSRTERWSTGSSAPCRRKR